MIQKLWIEGCLPGLNELIGAANNNRFTYGKLKKTWHEIIGWYINRYKIKPVERAMFTFQWREKNMKRDPDNICAGIKLIFDALVEHKILANDGWKQVAGIGHTFEVSKMPGVVVIIDGGII